MRVVIVVGFYDSVFVDLQKEHSVLLQNQTITWVGNVGPHGDGDILNFQSLLFDGLGTRQFTDVLVLVVVRRGREETFGERIGRIIQSAQDRHPDATIHIKPFAFAGASGEVDTKIRDFLELSSHQDAFPDTLNELEKWCQAERVINERLLILPQAVHEARHSPFEDVALVFKSLKVLANEYWDLRVNGGLDLKRKWHSALENLGLTVAPSISKSRAGEQRAEYYVNYPVGSPPGNTQFLEQHLKKGNDRDQRFCFRLYFFWDKKKRLVVVGWLPSHLDTRAT